MGGTLPQGRPGGAASAEAAGTAAEAHARGQEARLRARLDAAARDGPPVADGVCTLRGRDVCRIVEQEFGVVHTLGGIYDVLRRLGYSSLVPRPRHRKNDPVAVEEFPGEHAPLLPGP